MDRGGNDNFYLHVCSRDSAIYFPENKASDFRVKLAKPLHLKGYWKIGLCEVGLYNVTKVNTNDNEGSTNEDSTNNDDQHCTASINCNVCTGLIVNGVQTRILRKVLVEENIFSVYPIVYYVPLEKDFIDTIEFSINTSDGSQLSFDLVKGWSEMTLRLKRC